MPYTPLPRLPFLPSLFVLPGALDTPCLSRASRSLSAVKMVLLGKKKMVYWLCRETVANPWIWSWLILARSCRVINSCLRVHSCSAVAGSEYCWTVVLGYVSTLALADGLVAGLRRGRKGGKEEGKGGRKRRQQKDVVGG